MSKKIQYVYCKVCKKEVEESRRKPLETMQKVVWVIVIIATLGIGAIFYAIYLSNRSKSYCATCFTKLEYSDKPFLEPSRHSYCFASVYIDFSPANRVPQTSSLWGAGAESKLLDSYHSNNTLSTARRKKGDDNGV